MPSGGKDKLLWLGLGGVALLALAGGRAAAASRPRGGFSGSPSCPYPPSDPPLDKTRWDLIDRIYARIVEANPALRSSCGDCGGRSLAAIVAGALAQAEGMGVPPDLVVAVAWRESRFNPYVDRVTEALRLSKDGANCASGTEIGPMQVKPCAFRTVGMDPTLLLNMPTPSRIQYAVAAGIRYLRWLKETRLPGSTWCDVLHAYNVGPGAFLSGKRNPAYVQAVLAKAAEYSELRV
ncbi:lytic transglycosylase domain-containing protein [Thermus tengchongensis]|uniref:lytic transglycosylase domain-containing protein n=1 Tax=Thermus tengchongensis TaxID=1214928 RepID=UPI001F2CDF10|nr:lytic transglycosylase domain-containing protein [Thermus tengchongensis]